MTDPTFTTRAYMLAWVGRYARGRVTADAQLRALETIRRVTAAHSHLIEEQAP